MQDRIQELRQAIVNKRRAGSSNPPPFHWYYLEGFVAALDEPFEVREAKARLHFYQNVPITIRPGESIVGQLDWNEPLVSLVSNTHIRSEVVDRIMSSDLDESQKRAIAMGIEAARPFCFDPWPHLTEAEKLAQSSHLAPSTFFNGHIVPDYAYLLQRGLDGVLEDIQGYRNRPLPEVSRNFYRAMEITVQGMSSHISRYAELAESLLRDANPEYDAGQLRDIQTTCRKLSQQPAQTFPEALQMVWFLMCFVDYDSFGRFDQYLLPYYEYSRTHGMSADEALLWMKYTWIKIEECGAILNMTIGGRKSNGELAANPLTYLAMQATREMGFRSPNLSLRIRSTDPEQLWEAVHHALASGQGLPALYNDDLIIPMLVGMGYAEQEAMDYCLAGCSQVILPGRSNFACDVGCYNLLKALELALHDGFDIILNQQVGPHTGACECLDSFDKVKQAYDQQMRYMTRVGVSINNKDMFLRQNEGACVRSLLTRDCLARGRGIFHGGARFYNIQNEACGITNTANALAAVNKLVFEQQLLPLRELVRILDGNWEGQEGLRLRFRNKAEKFGNNLPEVDAIRAQISAEWYREIQQYPGVLGGFHWPGEVVFIYHEQHGAFTAASADGRKAGEPLANSAGADSGTDVCGPTALMSSMWQIPQDQCRTCCVLNLRFSKKIWQEAPQAIQNLMQTYFSQGGYQMQVNLVSRQDLLAARKNPEQYADLIVRVGGFSDYYVRLPESLQEEILARTEHELEFV